MTMRSTSPKMRVSDSLRARDPVVHRVERDDARPLALLQHIELQIGLRVGEEEDVGGPLLLVQLRLKLREHVELRLARFRDVEIEAVLAAPEEALRAVNPLQAVEIDVAALEDRRVLFREVVADDGDEIDGAKNEAATEKYVAEPPMQRSTFPNGVSIASNATVPTTVMLNGCTFR